MARWIVSGSSMSDEVCIQLVFPLLNTQRFVTATRQCHIAEVLSELKMMDEFLSVCLNAENLFVFDSDGNLISNSISLEDFGELEMIQLFVI